MRAVRHISVILRPSDQDGGRISAFEASIVFSEEGRYIIELAETNRSVWSTFMDRDDFLHHFEQVRERTMRVVRSIPADKIEWTCRDGEFTFGDLARHIAATERYVFAECACGRPSRYRGCRTRSRGRPRSSDRVHGANARGGNGDFSRDVGRGFAEEGDVARGQAGDGVANVAGDDRA